MIRSVDTEKFRCYGKEIVVNYRQWKWYLEDKIFKEDNQHCYAKTWVYGVAEKKQNREPFHH